MRPVREHVMGVKIGLILFLGLLVPPAIGVSTVFAANGLTLSRSGSGLFTVQGTELERVAGIKMTITYDPSTMKNPRISAVGLMSGAMIMPNSSTPGTLVLAMLQAGGVSGSGPVASVAFDLMGNFSGAIKGFTVNQMVNVGSENIAANTTLETETGTIPDSASGSGSGATTATAIASSWVGGVTPPSEGMATREKVKEPSPAPPPEPDPPPVEAQDNPVETARIEPSPPAAVDSPRADTPVEMKIATIKSVLDQFRQFRGEKTPKALVALFKSPESIVQEPPVALSDGKSKVKAVIGCSPAGIQTPNFSVKGAKLISFKRDDDAAWAIEVIPRKGVYEASISLLQDGIITEMPLTVAPPLPAKGKKGAAGKLTEADFSRFLHERGTRKTGRVDLNGDGKRDYIDDYIFTANYIVINGPAMKDRCKKLK